MDMWVALLKLVTSPTWRPHLHVNRPLLTRIRKNATRWMCEHSVYILKLLRNRQMFEGSVRGGKDVSSLEML